MKRFTHVTLLACFLTSLCLSSTSFSAKQPRTMEVTITNCYQGGHKTWLTIYREGLINTPVRCLKNPDRHSMYFYKRGRSVTWKLRMGCRYKVEGLSRLYYFTVKRTKIMKKNGLYERFFKISSAPEGGHGTKGVWKRAQSTVCPPRVKPTTTTN